jgi:hypothetical protein
MGCGYSSVIEVCLYPEFKSQNHEGKGEGRGKGKEKGCTELGVLMCACNPSYRRLRWEDHLSPGVQVSWGNIARLCLPYLPSTPCPSKEQYGISTKTIRYKVSEKHYNGLVWQYYIQPSINVTSVILIQSDLKCPPYATTENRQHGAGDVAQ